MWPQQIERSQRQNTYSTSLYSTDCVKKFSILCSYNLKKNEYIIIIKYLHYILCTHWYHCFCTIRRLCVVWFRKHRIYFTSEKSLTYLNKIHVTKFWNISSNMRATMRIMFMYSVKFSIVTVLLCCFPFYLKTDMCFSKKWFMCFKFFILFCYIVSLHAVLLTSYAMKRMIQNSEHEWNILHELIKWDFFPRCCKLHQLG